jgi:hypothetical protein
VQLHGDRHSLTDCISMRAVLDDGLTGIFTNHRHFEQEGFRVLFPPSQPRLKERCLTHNRLLFYSAGNQLTAHQPDTSE